MSLFNMVTFSNGAWSWETLYKLPVWLREFYINEFVKVKKQEQESMKNSLPRA
jgi:hypothetical protein